MINSPKSREDRMREEDKRIDEYVKADKWKEDNEEDKKEGKEKDNEAGK